MLVGGADFGDDLGATEAGRLAFLTEPAACRADLACGQAANDRIEKLGDPLGEAAVHPVEVLAAAAGTGRCRAEYLAWLSLSGQRQKRFRNRLRFGQVADPGSFRCSGHNAEDDRIRIGRLSAWALNDGWLFVGSRHGDTPVSCCRPVCLRWREAGASQRGMAAGWRPSSGIHMALVASGPLRT